MIPQELLANQPSENVLQFWTGGVGWEPVRKPMGKTMMLSVCCASGAGGGTGATGNTGGGGGGEGGVCFQILTPLLFVPDTMFVQVGVGGASATNGAATYLSTTAGQTTGAYLINAGGNSAVPVKGTNGGASGGAAGSGAAIANTIIGFRMPGDIAQQNGNLAGGAGGSNTTGGSITFVNNMIASGAGGGGGSSAGGNFTGAGNVPTITGGAGSGVGAASNGANGIFLLSKTAGLITTPGAGGGASTVGNGGNGGNGGPGCGGGGGGSSTAGGAGGAGGRGGDGFVIIWFF